MDPVVFVKGVMIGFAMAVPLGPIGTLCIRRTLSGGHSDGLVIGLGAATMDSLYAIVAAFGLTFVSDLIAAQHVWVRLGGGVVLIFLGIRTFRAKRRDPTVRYGNRGLLGLYISAILLSLTNPVTIIAFLAVFAALGLAHDLVFMSASVLVVGVFAGSWLWFLTLSFGATLFREKLDSRGLQWVDRVAGTVIILSGLAGFASLL